MPDPFDLAQSRRRLSRIKCSIRNTLAYVQNPDLSDDQRDRAREHLATLIDMHSAAEKAHLILLRALLMAPEIAPPSLSDVHWPAM